MDDNVDSLSNKETALLLYEQLTNLYGKAGIMARKLISNSKHVLEKIQVENKALKIEHKTSEVENIRSYVDSKE